MDPKPDPSPTTPNQTTTTSPEAKGSFQDRVNQLTRRASDAERAASTSVAENTELRTQLSRVEQQLAELASRSASPAPVLPASQETTPAGQPQNFDAMVQAISDRVLGVVKPVIDEVQTTAVNTQLAQKQKASFDAASRVHPELANADSELFKTFEKLWDGRPDLHQVDGSPQLLAEAARGLLSEARAADQIRKIAASAETPSSARPAPADAKADEEVSEALQTLAADGKEGGWSSDDMDDFLRLRIRQFGKTGK